MVFAGRKGSCKCGQRVPFHFKWCNNCGAKWQGQQYDRSQEPPWRRRDASRGAPDAARDRSR
eukprot:6085850-Pyramimonas_sp.AAC.1